MSGRNSTEVIMGLIENLPIKIPHLEKDGNYPAEFISAYVIRHTKKQIIQALEEPQASNSADRN